MPGVGRPDMPSCCTQPIRSQPLPHTCISLPWPAPGSWRPPWRCCSWQLALLALRRECCTCAALCRAGQAAGCRRSASSACPAATKLPPTLPPTRRRTRPAATAEPPDLGPRRSLLLPLSVAARISVMLSCSSSWASALTSKKWCGTANLTQPTSLACFRSQALASNAGRFISGCPIGVPADFCALRSDQLHDLPGKHRRQQL